MKICVAVKTNYFHTRSGYSTVEGLFATMEAAVRDYDANHRCEGQFCDFCRVPWTRQTGYREKRVNHDGAIVRYSLTLHRVQGCERTAKPKCSLIPMERS